MSHNWMQQLAALKKYISETPGIRIDQEVTAIPGEVRGEFYCRFDAVRTSYIKDILSQHLDGAYELSLNYHSTSGAIISRLGLDSIDLEADVKDFLRDPVKGLSQVLFDPLFIQLKGHTMPFEMFDELSRARVLESFRECLSKGYLLWATLSIIESLHPDSNYCVPNKDECCDPTLGDASHMHQHEETVPDPEKCRRISFQPLGVHEAFAVPKILIHSSRLKCFVAVQTGFANSEAMNRAKSVSQRREWLSIPGISKQFGAGNLWPDVSLYLASELDDLKMVADYGRIMRPDINLEVVAESYYLNTVNLKKIVRHHSISEPKFGTYIICREPISQASLEQLKQTNLISNISGKDIPGIENAEDAVLGEFEIQRGVHVVNAAYDTAKLETVVLATGEPNQINNNVRV